MSKKMKRNVILGAIALLLVAASIVLIIVIPKGSSSQDEFAIDYGIDMERFVHEDGLHDATIKTNDKGEIENNSYGTLLEYVPRKVSKIVIKNQDGDFVINAEHPVDKDGKTLPSVYTIEGYEDYTLTDELTNNIATAASAVKFTKVADLGGAKAADYGFDSPRAEATVYFNDDTYAVIRIGDDAPDTEHCFVQFGASKNVYVVAKDDVKALLIGFHDLFNRGLNNDNTGVPDDSFDKIILGGTHLKEEIVLVKNEDYYDTSNKKTFLQNTYLLESHDNMPANNLEGSSIVGSIKAPTAESVVCVNPSAEDLEKYGLKTPFATVKTQYINTEETYDAQGNKVTNNEVLLKVSLIASDVNSEGMVYMMEEGGALVYIIDARSAPWATTSLEKLYSEYVFYPNYEGVESVEITANSKTYKFDMTYDGTVKVALNGKSLDADQYWILYQDIVFIENEGQDTTSAKTGEILKIKYNYVTDRKSDTVVYSATDSQKVIATVNSRNVGYAFKNYLTSLVSNIEDYANGKVIKDIV